MSKPIKPRDIRVGDTVELRVKPIKVRRVGESTITSEDGVQYFMSSSWVESWNLVDRPKPEIGQHWVGQSGIEYVVIERGNELRFSPLRDKGLTLPANEIPQDWTLKS